MRTSQLITSLTAMLLATPVWAGHHGTPEISSNGSLAAIVAVAAFVLILWERRRRA